MSARSLNRVLRNSKLSVSQYSHALRPLRGLKVMLIGGNYVS